MASIDRTATLPASSMTLTADSPESESVARSRSFLQLEESSKLAGSAAWGRAVVIPRKASSNARNRRTESSDSSICLRSEINRRLQLVRLAYGLPCLSAKREFISERLQARRGSWLDLLL